jgi:hypothetical protein
MHLNGSGPCSHFGNRRPPARITGPAARANAPSAAGAEQETMAPHSPAQAPINRRNARAPLGNYTHVSPQNPRRCREAAALSLHKDPPIWRIPEPPILFLLVGKRGNAGNGSESALQNADVAQLVEHHLAKVDVASSNLVVRSQDTVTAKILPESTLTRWVGREARQRPAKPYTRVRIPYPPR